MKRISLKAMPNKNEIPKRLKQKLPLVLLVAVLLSFCSPAFAEPVVKWFGFDKEDALTEWQEKIFKGKVFYSVKIDRKEGYLRAFSNNSASGIFYKFSFDPSKEPMVSWKWKVVKFPDKKTGSSPGSDWIEKDDYAARFYVIFDAFFFFNIRTLEYVWDKSLPKGTIMTSPYYSNIKIIVAESGEKDLGNWIFEKRNIREDYRKAFGSEPSSVGAIAIMTDTDNSLSIAEAYYDEIKAGYKDE